MTDELLQKMQQLEGSMKILVACEESQAVTIEMRKLGHEAYSCDLIPCSGGHPEWHIQGDALEIINGNCKFKTMDGEEHEIVGKWDILIAHPPCTYLSNAGARWLYAGGKLNEKRYEMGLTAKAFFMAFWNADCERIAVENPIPSGVYKMPAYTQVVQPYEYGHPWSKKTCLWLKGLEPLRPTEIVEDHRPYCSSGSYSVTHDPRFKGASRKGGSAKSRSKTFPGIAKAMAEQWAGQNKEAGVWIDWPSCEYICSACGRSSEVVQALPNCPHCGRIMRTNEVYPNFECFVEEHGVPEWWED